MEGKIKVKRGGIEKFLKSLDGIKEGDIVYFSNIGDLLYTGFRIGKNRSRMVFFGRKRNLGDRNKQTVGTVDIKRLAIQTTLEGTLYVSQDGSVREDFYKEDSQKYQAINDMLSRAGL